MSNKSKHSQLVKASMGQFHRNEWAVLGDHCDAIHSFAHEVARVMAPLKVAYLDADHHPESPSSPLLYLQDQQYQWKQTFPKTDTWNIRTSLIDADILLVNGNHFSASRQIILVNAEKENSVRKRINNESRVEIIFSKKDQSIPSFISDLFPNKNHTYKEIDDMNISDFFSQKTIAAPLKVLIMVGGKSSRMGSEKSQLNYRGKSHDLFIADLCTELNLPFAFSCSNENAARYAQLGFEVITDTFLHLGPKGGILSAFQSQPDTAWLTVACDLPFIEKSFFTELIANRQFYRLATAYLSPVNEMPEPLACIWEPKSYARALQFLALGNSCPRKVLLQSDIYVFNASEPKWLTNVNTPEEAALTKKQLS